ncbi:MAG: universal stress protein [Acidobacteriota bacterium]
MAAKAAVLCPIDFSDSSRGALRYAVAIARHAGGTLTVLTVLDPLLSEAAEIELAAGYLPGDTAIEIERFYRATFPEPPEGLTVRFEVAMGKAADEILRVAREHAFDLVVIASHGLTGFRKMFFGSTTERVLRESSVPVLVSPGGDPGPVGPDDARRLVRRLLVSVDLTSATSLLLEASHRIAATLGVPLLLVHVIEPVRAMLPSERLRVHSVEGERRARAEREMEALVATLADVRAEGLLAYGEPAEEIAKVGRDRDAGLIVLGIHSSLLGPHVGSVTYRVLCLVHKLVLALPPNATLGRFLDQSPAG